MDKLKTKKSDVMQPQKMPRTHGTSVRLESRGTIARVETHGNRCETLLGTSGNPATPVISARQTAV